MARVEDVSGYYGMPPRSIETVVEEKIRILRDFYIVDDTNEKDIRMEFRTELRKNAGKDLDIVADRLAKRYISEKLYGG